MSCYESLSEFYDFLTNDVKYSEFIDLYKAEFSHNGGEFRLILDLCCGTGTITKMLNEEGFDVIAVDASEDMLIEAQEKCPSAMFICQKTCDLDLFGTVDACISSLDSINYIPYNELKTTVSKLRLFIRPQGLFIFDIRNIDWMESMDGYTSVDENDNMLCLWRADYENNILIYGMDLFKKCGKHWERYKEEHIEYAYSIEQLAEILINNEFELIKTIKKENRTFIICKNNRTT